MRAPTVEELRKRKCRPCEGGVQPFSKEKAEGYLTNLPGWELSEDGRSIRRTYTMRWFMDAIELIQGIAEIAEEEQHHPDLHLTGYRRLTVELSTHAIGGLSENDFILAAKIEALPKPLKQTP